MKINVSFEIFIFIAPMTLQFTNNLQTVSVLDRKEGDNLIFDCKFKGRPKPKIIWFKGKLFLNNDSAFQFGNDMER